MANLDRLLLKSRMSFPNAFIGNPVLINSINYGCPTETFGHDNLKGSWTTVH